MFTHNWRLRPGPEVLAHTHMQSDANVSVPKTPQLFLWAGFQSHVSKCQSVISFAQPSCCRPLSNFFSLVGVQLNISCPYPGGEFRLPVPSPLHLPRAAGVPVPPPVLPGADPPPGPPVYKLTCSVESPSSQPSPGPPPPFAVCLPTYHPCEYMAVLHRFWFV